MDDAMNNVAMNVEVTGGTSEAMSQNRIEIPVAKSAKRHSSYSYQEQNDNCETIMEYEAPNIDFDMEHLNDSELFLLVDEKLVKLGDKFESLEAFVHYLNEHAKIWNYFYTCTDSQKPNTEQESYTYSCVYHRNKESYRKKSAQKRNQMKSDCPCKIKIQRVPNEDVLTVVYVCNYHDHDLSTEQVLKSQQGKRLPHYVKEEILDLLSLYVDKRKIRNYVEMETGLRLGDAYFYSLERNMLLNTNPKREITDARLKTLNKKLAAANEMLRHNTEENEQNGQNADDMESPHRFKQRRISKRNKNVSKSNKQSKGEDEESATNLTEDITLEPNSEYQELLQSVMNLQELVGCETEKNPWASDQCLPDLPNRTTQEETEYLNIEYLDSNDSGQEMTENGDMDEFVNNTEAEVQNDSNNIAYEELVVEADDGEVINNVTQHSVSNDEVLHSEIAIENSEIVDENSVVHLELQGNEDGTEVQYVTEDNEQVVGFICTNNEEVADNEIAVQTNGNKGQTLLPVFDVVMKGGNVMGFVVNDKAVNGLKEGIDEAIQTSEDIIYSDILEVENEDSEIIERTNDQNKKTYTKHEYVHRYNIEQYMTLSHFPKYVEILAKETDMDILDMFTNIYNEKGMFKLTTTQKGNEGNTRIRYITHNGKMKKKKVDHAKREKFGRNLQSIFILKEKMRMLKKKNVELMQRNEQLQDIALKIVNLK